MSSRWMSASRWWQLPAVLVSLLWVSCSQNKNAVTRRGTPAALLHLVNKNERFKPLLKRMCSINQSKYIYIAPYSESQVHKFISFCPAPCFSPHNITRSCRMGRRAWKETQTFIRLIKKQSVKGQSWRRKNNFAEAQDHWTLDVHVNVTDHVKEWFHIKSDSVSSKHLCKEFSITRFHVQASTN